jgi:beta-mannosidase
MASFRALGDGEVELWVTNDTLAHVNATARIELETLAGETLSMTELQVSVAATASVRIWQGHPEAAADRVLLVRSPQFGGNRHFFAALKNVPFSPDAPTMDVQRIDAHTLSITLTATNYVYGARLLTSHAATRFSDNFFDLFTGESRSISVSHQVLALVPGDVTLRYGISEGRDR